MNRFAALDNSDNEEETPKVSTQKKTKEQSATKVAKKEPVKTEKAKGLLYLNITEQTAKL